MKFQNPSFKFFLNGRTHGRTSRKQYVPHFFKVGGIKSGSTIFSIITLWKLSVAMENIAKSEQSSHTPGRSHQRPFHFDWKERKMDK